MKNDKIGSKGDNWLVVGNEMRNPPAFIITMLNNPGSVASARECVRSIEKTKSYLNPVLFRATTPDTIVEDIHFYLNEYENKLLTITGQPRYTWPVNAAQDGLDLKTGLYKKHYKTNDVNKVIACAVSHMRLWHMCHEMNVHIVVLEHDARFVRQCKPRWAIFEKEIVDKYPHTDIWYKGLVGLNDPRGATRRSMIYHNKVEGKVGCRPVPSVQQPGEEPVPEGLAGNSAYCISPSAAKQLLEATAEHGIWPNDAIMNKQMFPWIQQYWPYFSVVDRSRRSTTTQ